MDQRDRGPPPHQFHRPCQREVHERTRRSCHHRGRTRRPERRVGLVPATYDEQAGAEERCQQRQHARHPALDERLEVVVVHVVGETPESRVADAPRVGLLLPAGKPQGNGARSLSHQRTRRGMRSHHLPQIHPPRQRRLQRTRGREGDGSRPTYQNDGHPHERTRRPSETCPGQRAGGQAQHRPARPGGDEGARQHDQRQPCHAAATAPARLDEQRCRQGNGERHQRANEVRIAERAVHPHAHAGAFDGGVPPGPRQRVDAAPLQEGDEGHDACPEHLRPQDVQARRDGTSERKGKDRRQDAQRDVGKGGQHAHRA